MLQRKQTLYMLASLVFLALLFFMPLAIVGTGEGAFYLYYHGFTDNQGTDILLYPQIIMLALTIIFQLWAIFLYKKRMLQMRINNYNMMLMLGFMLMAFYFYYDFTKENSIEMKAGHFELAYVFPIVSIILTWMANRLIRKDEKLVRSLDRIR